MWQKLVLSANSLVFLKKKNVLETSQSIQKSQHAFSRYKADIIISLHDLKKILSNHSSLNGIEMKGGGSATRWVLGFHKVLE